MIAALKALLNPTTLLAIIAAMAIGGAGGAYLGYEFRLGKDAQQQVASFDQALKDTRKAVKAEDAEAAAAAEKQNKLRAAARDRQHKLDVELAKDEVARTCRINDDSWSVLHDNLDRANSEATAGGVDAALPTVRPPVQSVSGRIGDSLGRPSVGLRP